jgi:hypothetical protein
MLFYIVTVDMYSVVTTGTEVEQMWRTSAIGTNEREADLSA